MVREVWKILVERKGGEVRSKSLGLAVSLPYFGLI
jgi:hypothetical protein